ncbi:MAG: high-potential iron-sulfur protein [Rhodothermales bacterium]
MPDHTSPAPTTPSLLSRRSFLGRLAAVGAVGLGGSTLLAACGGDEATTAGTSDGARVVEASSCEGYDALDPQALQTRQALGYVDATPREGQNCANCRFYTQPQGGSPCGGCQLFAGPVSPAGWCQSWAAQAA